MSPLVISIVLVVYALILWVMVFFVWHKGYREWQANRADRLRKFEARVMDRREAIASTKNLQKEPTTEYLVAFEFAGRQRELKVGPDAYPAMRVGQEGTLYLRGDRFEAFEPKQGSDQMEEVYRKMVKG